MRSLFRNPFIEGSNEPMQAGDNRHVCCTHHVSIHKNEFESVSNDYHVRNNE